jgi:perosamine synthetase
MTSEHLQIQDRYTPVTSVEADRITEVLRRGMLYGGAPVVAEYEAALAARFGASQAVAVNSRSSALYAVLAALGAAVSTGGTP